MIRSSEAELLFEGFRERYDAMSFREQVGFYKWVAGRFPDQAGWDPIACDDFLAAFGPATICELGGWDGGLAAAMLPNQEAIVSWDNYDLVGVPQVCDDPRYALHVLEDWFWVRQVEAEAFVASHVVEHLSTAHLLRLLDAIDGCRFLFITTPLNELERPRWRGYYGSHVLPFSWAELRFLLASRGWRERGHRDISRWFVHV